MSGPVLVGELLPEVLAEVVQRAGPGYGRWAELVAQAGYCHHPIRLRGRVEQADRATGEDQGVPVACGPGADQGDHDLGWLRSPFGARTPAALGAPRPGPGSVCRARLADFWAGGLGGQAAWSALAASGSGLRKVRLC